jgi:hypothetical protein
MMQVDPTNHNSYSTARVTAIERNSIWLHAAVQLRDEENRKVEQRNHHT